MPRTHMLPTLPPCRFEQLLWDNWQAHKRSTLAVVCLPLGCLLLGAIGRIAPATAKAAL